MYNWRCLVCNHDNAGEFPSSNVCDTCGWEQDALQHSDPNYRGGANQCSLNEAREKWLRANHIIVPTSENETRILQPA